MSETIKVIPVAIWTGDMWIEQVDRRKWPRGSSPVHVITELEPALGVATVGRQVLPAHAMDELELATSPDFGEDTPREAYLVIGVVPR